MADDLMKGHDVDGFETFEAGVEGDDRPQGAGVIQGSILKFTNEATWVDRAGERVPADLELVAVDIGRVVQKWKDDVPVETRILGPGEKFPDLEKLNNSTPRIEWIKGKGSDGKLRGPWQAQHVLYLLNPATMDRYSWPTGTTGGAKAVRELVDKTKWMRRFRGAHVYPVVTLSDTFMPTRYGGRQRPDLLIKRWITLGADEKILPAPTQASGTKELEKPAEAMTQAGARAVEAPTRSEEMNDSIPSDEDGSKSGRKALPPSKVAQVTKRGVVKIVQGGRHPHGAK